MNPRLKPRASFLLFLAFVLAQLYFVLLPNGHDRYRLKERLDAYRAWHEAPSMSTKATMNEELDRLRRHNSIKLISVGVPLLIIDVFCIVRLSKDRRDFSANTY